jgi:two-component system chemotaxis response regulator CheB
MVFIAPGDRHMKISSNGKKIEVCDAPPVNRFRPSVDFMFSSVPQKFEKKIIGTLLTGMGKDGAQGLLELKNKGATTIAQDEASCVVFGMPKVAIQLGAAVHVKALDEIANFWVELMSKKK